MARREDVDNSIWADADFDALSPNAALLYLWSFTNQRCGMAGIYRVASRQILEGKLSDEERDRALAELAEARFCFYVDGVLWVRSRAKHLRTKGENMLTAIRSDLEKIPSSNPLVRAFLEEAEGSWYGRVREGFGDTLRTPFEGFEEGSNFGSTERNSEGSSKGIGRVFEDPPGYGYGKGKGKNLGGEERKEDARAPVADDLVPFVDALSRVADGKRAKPVKPHLVAKACDEFAGKDLAGELREFEHYWLEGRGAGRKLSDVVSAWRKWLQQPYAKDAPKDRSVYDRGLESRRAA